MPRTLKRTCRICKSWIILTGKMGRCPAMKTMKCGKKMDQLTMYDECLGCPRFRLDKEKLKSAQT